MRHSVVAVTLGDPAGIGPEVVAQALARFSHKQFTPLVIGRVRDFLPEARRAGLSFRRLEILEPKDLPQQAIIPGKPSALSGKISAACVRLSAELALQKKAACVMHSPIAKFAWKLAGLSYPGHTEWLAEICNIKKFAMAMSAGELRAVMVTRHLPISQVAAHLKSQDIVDAIVLAESWLKNLGVKRASIGVSGLNPHAGEKGHLGREEMSLIAPAIRRAESRLKARLSGPLPIDSAWKAHREKKYNVLVAMYHDQVLAPLKLWAGEDLVNITLGLPFARTSPGHGTAFDIAGRNLADWRPTLSALKAAIQQIR